MHGIQPVGHSWPAPALPSYQITCSSLCGIFEEVLARLGEYVEQKTK